MLKKDNEEFKLQIESDNSEYYINKQLETIER